jgi:hypothetical protein
MANEIHADYKTGEILYATRFQPDGNVFITDGSADQVWSDPTLYNVPMTENGNGGHYEGDFDTLENIGAGVYQITVFLQTGGSPSNGDPQLYKGEIYWDGVAEITIFTLDIEISTLTVSQSRVLNVYGEGE